MSQYRISAVLWIVAVCMTCSFGQSSATFQVQTQQLTNNNRYPGSLSAVDVNNDGVPDLVETDAQIPSSFDVYLANGDGTFGTGFTYTFSITYQRGTPLVAGDFNGDGLADLVFVLNGTNQVAVFLGKGDGTFQTPKYETVALPSGVLFGSFTVAAGDFNRDGKIDFAAAVYKAGMSYMDVIPGNGDGTFGTPVTVYTPAAGHGVGSSTILTGDFDGDARADIAFTDLSNCNEGNTCTTALHVLYGDGGFTFTDTTAYTSSYSFTFGAGDVNSDGRSDLFAVVGLSSQQLAVLYGETNRTFALYTQAVSSGNGISYFDAYSPFQLGDFNGDGRMDIVGYTRSGPGFFRIFLGTSTQGTFTENPVALPGYGNSTPLVVGDFNRDLKPDILAVGGNNGDNFIVEALNTTTTGSWGNCAYPGIGEGISLCSPFAYPQASPVHFNAAANSYGNLRKIALWVDGTKVGEQRHAWEQRAWFEKNIAIAPGSHYATFLAADVDNHLQKENFSFNVVNCTAPSSAGVHVCSPLNGSSVYSPVQALAAATVSGRIERMEVWVDGTQQASTYWTNALSASISLAAGMHRFDFYAVNTAGTKWESTVYFTVK